MSDGIVNIVVGCYGDHTEETIQWLQFDTKDARITHVYSVSGVENPSFLTVNAAHMYSVSEIEQGEIVAFSIDTASQRLHEINRASTNGWGPCYLEVDSTNDYIFSANYGGGNVVVHQIQTDGSIGVNTEQIDYTQLAEARKLATHPHMIHGVPNTNQYIVPDLGLNCLFVYTLNPSNGKLTFVSEIEVPERAGPRHLTFGKNHPNMYVVNELDSTVLVYSYSEDGTSFELEQRIHTIPDEYEEKNYCADIHLSVDGQYIFASNRGHHSLVSYKITENGQLMLADCLQLAGEWPRNFAVMPNGKHILVANEHSNTIEVVEIAADGMLVKTEHVYHIKQPVCIQTM